MAGGSCQRGRMCQSGGMTTEGFQPEGERPDVPWGVLTVVLWVIAVIGFVGVPLAFHDEKQARDRAHRSEAEVAQVFGAAVEEGIAPAAAGAILSSRACLAGRSAGWSTGARMANGRASSPGATRRAGGGSRTFSSPAAYARVLCTTAWQTKRGRARQARREEIPLGISPGGAKLAE